jgi:hypothetical protein
VKANRKRVRYPALEYIDSEDRVAEVYRAYEREHRRAMEVYEEIAALGVRNQELRRLMPVGWATSAYVYVNARALRHFFELRLDSSAEWEIRRLAYLMLDDAMAHAPSLFEGLALPGGNGQVPTAREGVCPVGRMEGFAPGPDETLDVLACGGLGVFQKREGYRYSLDAYLLAAFVDEGPGTRVLEIGSGSGVVAMMLASLKGLLVMGVEIQRELAEMSMRSVGRAGLEGKVGVVCADIRTTGARRWTWWSPTRRTGPRGRGG